MPSFRLEMPTGGSQRSVPARRGRLQYDSTEVHAELLHDESIAFATDVLYPESDHAPIVASFTQPKEIERHKT